MACPCEIRILARQPQAALQAALAEVRRLERKYSRWRDDSPWLRLLRQARQAAGVPVDEETGRLLRYALDAWRLSEGHFHPGLLPLWRYWQRVEQPDETNIATLLAEADLSGLRLRGGRLWLADKLELDLDGLVKEYAVDRACETLLRLCPEARCVVVNLGGDIRVAGPEAHPVGIVGMGAEPGRVILRNQALASSGTRERGRVIQGRWYSHLIHPRTGWPLPGRDLQLSVCSPTCLLAGTLSTAALLMGENGPGWLRRAGVPFLWQQGERQIEHLWNHGA